MNKEEMNLEWIEPDDVFLVEDTIKELDNPTPKELLEKLPEGFNKKTLNNILYYFLNENMIVMNDNHIVWIS